jgi:hypothetical protein
VVDAVADHNFGYDANGNMSMRSYRDSSGAWRSQTLAWNHENQLASVSGPGVSESYWYAPDGQRVKKTSNGVSSYYVHPLYEVEGTMVRRHYWFAGMPVAVRWGATRAEFAYLHTDHLGGIVAQTTFPTISSASTVHRRYYAFGSLRYVDGGFSTAITEQDFTGQRLDASGLLYFHARYDE